MIRSLLSFLLCTLCAGVIAQTSFSGTLESGDPTFIRPAEGEPPTMYSGFTNVRYDVYPLVVTSAGLVTVSVTSNFDDFVILYDQAGFSPAFPLTNALIANDDYVEQHAGFSYNLPAAGQYFVVVCSYKNNVTGSYTLTATSGTLLPLKLVSFTASKTAGNKNLIKWTSSAESDLLHYQVQKSVDNIIFKDLLEGLFPASNNFLGHSYNFIDENAGTGNVYYRLKIYEKSGDILFSNIAVVKQATAFIISAFPNPTVDVLQVQMKTMQGKQILAAIINSSGAVVQSGEYKFDNFASLKLNVATLKAGAYFLKITSNTEQSIISFIKK